MSKVNQGNPMNLPSHGRGRRFKPCITHHMNQRLTALLGAVFVAGVQKVFGTGVSRLVCTPIAWAARPASDVPERRRDLVGGLLQPR